MRNTVSKNKGKFMMYDWDECVFKVLQTHSIIKAIHTAWNYEFDVYEVDTEELIFSGKEDNETNSEWLESYGIRLIDDPEGRYRVLQNIDTGEIYRADWQ